MPDAGPAFSVRIAETEDELRAAQALRYDIFVRELGGNGAQVDHDCGLERDDFDAFADHLLLMDERCGRIAGVYRLMRESHAGAAGRFYSQSEFDLEPLRKTGRRLLELGRSCLHADYRGGFAMHVLWSGLAEYVERHGIEILFGVASFHGTNVGAIAEPLSHLRASHLAPPELRPRSKVYQPMDLIPPEQIDRKRAVLAIPALIKGYLRLGGHVGDGAFVDHDFNTTDICLVLDAARMNPRQQRLYSSGA